MRKKQQTVLIPQYMKKFACIGPSCEDLCCKGNWRVYVDKATYKKYKKLPNSEIKSLIESTIKRDKKSQNDVNYAVFHFNEKGLCPLLSEDNFCRIHSELGESYLSHTCAVYPRVVNIVNNSFEKSALLSCPEVARLALLDEKGIEFEYVEDSLENLRAVTKQLFISEDINDVQNYFWELRIFTIKTLQDRRYSLFERLLFLGIFYNKVQERIDAGQINLIPELINSYQNLWETNELIEKFKDIPTQLHIQMEFCKALVDYRASRGIDNERYRECLFEMLNGLQYTMDSTVEEITERYMFAYKEYYFPFIRKHEYILENYLVNHVYKNLFPFGQETVFEDYVMLIIHYSLIKLHLIGMSAYHQGLTIELVIKLISSFARTVEHNITYLQYVKELLKQNGYNTLAYMAILIKN